MTHKCYKAENKIVLHIISLMGFLAEGGNGKDGLYTLILCLHEKKRQMKDRVAFYYQHIMMQQALGKYLPAGASGSFLAGCSAGGQGVTRGQCTCWEISLQPAIRRSVGVTMYRVAFQKAPDLGVLQVWRAWDRSFSPALVPVAEVLPAFQFPLQ